MHTLQEINKQLEDVRFDNSIKWYAILIKDYSQNTYGSDFAIIEKSTKNKLTITYYTGMETPSLIFHNATWTQTEFVTAIRNISYKKSKIAIAKNNPNHQKIQSIENISIKLPTWNEYLQLDGDCYELEIGIAHTTMILRLTDSVSFESGYAPLKDWIDHVLSLNKDKEAKLLYMQKIDKQIRDLNRETLEYIQKTKKP
jgi:hypothetical protein